MQKRNADEVSVRCVIKTAIINSGFGESEIEALYEKEVMAFLCIAVYMLH